MASTNTLNNFLFDTKWHLSQRIYSFSQRSMHYSYTCKVRTGHAKSGLNQTQDNIFQPNVYISHSNENLNALHSIIYTQHIMPVFKNKNKWSVSPFTLHG